MFTLPPYGRPETFDRVLSFGLQLVRPNILEIGCLRRKSGVKGDGYSSALFSYIANMTDGKFITVDINPKSTEACLSVLTELHLKTDNVFIITNDALKVLSNWKLFLDIFYLDGWDFGSVADSPEKHLSAFLLIQKFMKTGSVLLIDDMVTKKPPYKGKGSLVIPYCLDHGYEIVYPGYTFMLRKI